MLCVSLVHKQWVSVSLVLEMDGMCFSSVGNE